MISRFQKKCFLASAGMHGLLFVVLLIGPAFFVSQKKPDDLPTLNFIPAKLIDEQFYRVTAPEPQPEKAPPVQPPQRKTVRPPEPKPPVQKSPPKYTKAEDIKVNLHQRRRPSTKTAPSPPRRDYQSAADTILKAISTTTIDLRSMPAGGGIAYANYAQAVKSIYERNWYPPSESSRDDALVRVEIVIARDGTILSSRVIGRSGDAAVDVSVEAALRRVTRVPAFPEGAKENKRTYTIGFNLKTRR